MIAYKEEDRSENIEEILNDAWFNEIRDLNNEQKEQLEKEVRGKFIEKEKTINDKLIIDPLLFDFSEYRDSSENKGVSKRKDYKYFKPNFKLEKKNIQLNGDFYVKFLGNFDYCYFMDYFVKTIKEKYEGLKETCFIPKEKIKSNYKCNIEFQKEEDDDENEENENKKKDLIIKLNLYRSGDEEIILRFLRKSGDLSEYNEKVTDFISMAKELNKKTN